jgi:predicted dehydrogenase
MGRIIMSEQKSPQDQALNRRAFLSSAAALAAGATVGVGVQKTAKADIYKSILPSTVLGANEMIRTGHIGMGGQGRVDMSQVLKRDDMQPIAVCDIYPKNLKTAEAMAKSKNKEATVTTYTDFRELLANKDIDAVVIATPDHWHCLPVLYAVEAGKDIYCEKPLSTNIAEGIAMVNAVKGSKVVFQGGTMQRSGEHFQEAVKLVQDGYIGKVARVETWIYDKDPIKGIGHGETDISKFPDIDQSTWELYQGWTEHQPFNMNRWIYNFRWFLDYSGGKMTDWGAHLVDIAVWGMGQEKQPKSVTCLGGKYVVQDDRTTPDTLDVLWEFDDYVLSFQNRVWNQYTPKNHHEHGIAFHGTLGTLVVSRGGYNVYPVDNNEGCEEKSATESLLMEPHWQNFADCIRSREKCIVDVETLHNTTRLCHMGTTCYAVGGAKLQWVPESQNFTGGDTGAVEKANAFAHRPYQNGWSLEAPHYKA